MPIVYFDGHCSLCNFAIDFLIRRDHARRLRFAPLQGSTAAARLPADLIARLGTMVFEDEHGLATESTGAIRALTALGGVYSLARAFVLLPKFLRDPAYRFIARHRYRWFGRRNTCRVPTAEERDRFLD